VPLSSILVSIFLAMSTDTVRQWIKETRERLARRNVTSLRKTLLEKSFQFTSPPETYQVGVFHDAPDLRLHQKSPSNALALDYEASLKSDEMRAKQQLRKFPEDSETAGQLVALLDDIKKEYDELDKVKRVEWERQRVLYHEKNQANPGKCYLLSLSWIALTTVLRRLYVKPVFKNGTLGTWGLLHCSMPPLNVRSFSGSVRILSGHVDLARSLATGSYFF
jgi:hypothetical protein